MPVLIILIDEYAELVDEAPEAVKYADSSRSARPCGRGQPDRRDPAADAEGDGQGAVRSQMDVRVCFRVRERKDVDLILGQGMLAAGWNAHALNAPGKFLISAAEHDTPRRARAYLLTDQAVANTALWYADLRPALDPVSAAALGTSTGEGPADPDDGPDWPDPAAWRGGGRRAGPDALLWAALSIAPEQGVPVADLVAATGRSHRWVNYRLRALAESGQVIQVRRGMWRVASPGRDVP